MIDYIRYRLALRRLFKQKRKVRETYHKLLSAARLTGMKPSCEDYRALEWEAWSEEGMIDEEIAILVTDYLSDSATKRFIPIPSRQDERMWEQCGKISLRYVLTNEGVSALRSAIRAERKEQRDLVLPVIAIVTGVIGSVTGIIALLKRW